MLDILLALCMFGPIEEDTTHDTCSDIVASMYDTIPTDTDLSVTESGDYDWIFYMSNGDDVHCDVSASGTVTIYEG